jgi:hypothetical protein
MCVFRSRGAEAGFKVMILSGRDLRMPECDCCAVQISAAPALQLAAFRADGLQRRVRSDIVRA